MKKHPRVFLFFSLLLAAAVLATVTASLQVKKESDPPKEKREYAKEQYDRTKFPTTDIDRPESSDLNKRRLRQIRGNRFKLRDNVDRKRFEITEDSQSTYGAFEIHAKPEPAIPAAQSDAVVIGEVTAAEAFLATEKTSIYSEFTVSIGDVLKGVSPKVFPNALITAIRGGGAVRFPSGKIVWEGFDGKPFPRIGRRYLFFLKQNNDGGEDFSIITAYELRGGKIFPLDGLYTNGQVVAQLAAHQKFDGTDEATFLTTVREAIARAQSNTQGGE